MQHPLHKDTKLFFGKGQIVDPFAFTADELTAVDVARSLSRINRFTGHGSLPLSVAQHCVTLSYMVPADLRRAALLHDIGEIFIGDVPAPIKRICPQLEAIEERILRRVSTVFRVPYERFLQLRPYDTRISHDEARSLFGEPDPDVVIGEGFGIEVIPNPAREAEEEWVTRFYELFLGEGFDD
jgi:hypothetical protein